MEWIQMAESMLEWPHLFCPFTVFGVNFSGNMTHNSGFISVWEK